MPSIADMLPSLYRPLLPSVFHEPVREESKATCSACAMAPSQEGGVRLPLLPDAKQFRPDLKCCTYHPKLPNYLVGALLADERPEFEEGRRRMRAKIAHGESVTPRWVHAPATYTLLYERSSNNTFGAAETLACPYLDRGAGACTIWPYREAVCSTYYCKHSAGVDGHMMWMTTKQYLSHVEAQLSRYALFQILPKYIIDNHENLLRGNTVSVEDADGLPKPETSRRKAWDTYFGREEDLYRACYDVVRALDAEALARILGFEGTMTAAILAQHRTQATTTSLPEVMRFDATTTNRWLDDGRVVLVGSNKNEVVAIPGEAYELLMVFDGERPVSEVREYLRSTRQADLSDEVLVALYQLRILVKVDK